MPATQDKIKLDDCIEDHAIGGDSTKYTHSETGAWVEIVLDDDPGEDPTQRGDSDMHCWYLENSRYGNGNPEVPQDFDAPCPRCDGSGSDPERVELTRGYYGPVVAAGSLSAMQFIVDQEERKPLFTRINQQRLSIDPACCLKCKGEGKVYYADGVEWLKKMHGAIAVCVFDTGDHGEATAFMWTDCDEWTTPDEAVKAWAEEYNQWAEGDCWGIKYGTSRGEHEESGVWGFIGRVYAEQEASTYLTDMVIDVQERVANNIELGST